MPVFSTLAPVFLIVALGAVLIQTGFVHRDLFNHTNRLVYWVGLPALLFYKTAEIPSDLGEVVKIVIVLSAGLAGCLLLGYIVSLVWRMPAVIRGTFVQGAFRGNLAYVGLPVVLYAISGSESAGEGIAFLAIAPLIPLYNFAAVLVLSEGRGKSAADEEKGGGAMAGVLWRILTNPLIIACVAGLLYSMAGLKLPAFVSRTCEAIGQMALPLALLGIGATLTFGAVKGVTGKSLAAASIKTLGAPLFGFMVASALQLSSLEMRIALLYLACPTAVTSYVMAQQMGGDDRLATGIVVVSTLMSAVSLWLVLVLT
ncbi:MAG: AEC family transporter [Lentisphaeria bacterium]